MNKAYTIILAMMLSMTFTFPEVVWGLAVGIIPDRLVFGGGEETFRILNPNDMEVEFRIDAGNMACVPEEGRIMPKGSTDVRCTAGDNARQEELILVETMLKGKDETVGILPAVAVKAEIKENAGGEATSIRRNPLMIDATGAESQQQDDQTGTGEDWLADMKKELATIALLTAAIISVLTHSEIKRRKELKTRKENDLPREPSVPSDESKDPPQERDQSIPRGCGHP
ncbi:hypothetical protein JW898_05400 [Candidatus Woesearchaeota archaeon]|nr:hypothetical protein [Candidatus Woesearchaeota archaeon]